MKLIVMIPARNEEESIGAVVKSIPRQISGIDKTEILVVNDASSDRTEQAARSAGADYVIGHRPHQGLALTFYAGLEFALKKGADIVVNTDADNQYDQAEIPKLVKPILDGEAEFVIGDRQIKKLDFMPKGNKYGNIIGSWVIRFLTGSAVNDASSGFRAFSREAALRLNIHFNHTYTHETIIQAAFNNMTIAEVPVSFRARQHGQSKLIHGLFSHIKKSLSIIVRTILLYKPLKTLAYASLLFIVPGIVLGLRFLYYFFNNNGEGKIQSLILTTILIILGFLLFTLGLIGDLIARNRKLSEHILYKIKKHDS